MSKNVVNPIILADIPDPSVIRVNDTYYMTSTTMYFTPGCPIMKSKDLVNWEIVNYVYDIIDDNDHMNLQNGKHDYGRGSWASSLRYHNGIFYVAFVAYCTGKTYIYQTTDIEAGPWRRYEIDGIYHDMSILFDDDGRVYMVYGGGAIKLIELTADATAIKPGGLNTTIIENADISGGNSLAEGAHIYKLNGYYYIFIIVWPRTGTRRRIEVCYRASSIDGLYEGKIMFDDDMGFNNAGVAQGGIVDTPDGKWYGFLFQDHGAVGRVPVLVPVTWEGDWPIFGDNGKMPTIMPWPADEYTADALIKPDDFTDTTLGLTWQWNHNPKNSDWSLTARPGWLRLKSNKCNSLSDAVNTLTQRTFGPKCTGSICMDISHMQDGDFAGLAALQDQYGFVGIKMANGEKHIIMAEAPDTTKEAGIEGQRIYKTGVPETEVEAVPTTANVVYLKVDFDFTDAIDEAEFYYSYDNANWVKIGRKLKMSYRLSHFTGYRFALFSYATKAAGGYVDFDWFRVSAL
ncbi:MAG: glycoside hydrolase 43 family protein [Defluviitaleaceae bacterium]|nr:glycoside hydrolase 43 family protein [Defluviitaleaceae bacterium]